MTNLVPLMSSADDTWNTPRWFIDRLERALGRVGLDPCSNYWSEVCARRNYQLSRGEDGLALTWTGQGLVYLNPPYGRVIGEWMDKAADCGAEVVALVPSRTDAKWWQHAAFACSALLLWRGRFRFLSRGRKGNTAPFPSSVFYFGTRPQAFLGEFADAGYVAKGHVPIETKEAA